MKGKDANYRNLARRNLLYYLSVKNGRNGEKIGEIGDLNKGGLLVLTDELLLVGKEMEVSVELPKGEEFSEDPLRLKIEVQWARKDKDNPDLYLAGCKIKDIDKKNRDTIDSLIKKIGFSNGQRKILLDDPGKIGFSE